MTTLNKTIPLRITPLIFLALLGLTTIVGSCGGDGADDQSGPLPVGEGQTIVFHRNVPTPDSAFTTSGPNDLYLIRENGGGLVTLGNAPEDERYAGYNDNGHIIYIKHVIDSYDVYVCPNPSIPCLYPVIYSHTASVTHHILHSVREDGSDTLAFSTPPDHTAVYVTEPGVIPQPYTVNHDYITHTADGRIIYSNNGNLLSRYPDSNESLLLSDSFDHVHAVSNSNRIIYSNGGDLFAINSDGSMPTVLAGTTANEAFRSLTPGGEVIYSAESGGQVDLYRTLDDGTGTVLILSGACQVTDVSCSIGVHSVTLEGQLIFIKGYMTESYQREVYSVKIDGSEASILVYSCATKCGISAITTSGQVILTVSEPNSIGNMTDILSVALDGSQAKSPSIISANPLLLERFSGITPTGRIVFEIEETVDGPGGRSIYDLYTADDYGLNQRPLSVTAGIDDHFETFSKSGRVLLKRGFARLYSTDEKGGGEVLLANDCSEHVVASTSYGRVIYQTGVFINETQAQLELRSVRENGSLNIALAPSGNDERYADLY
jgi:hypothetical protein